MDIKTRILEQASEMFFTQGIRSITMTQIAEKLGMSKRTLYESFENKEELLKACIDWKYQQGKKFLKEVENKYGDDPLEIIHQHFRYGLINLSNLHPGFSEDLKKYHGNLMRQHVLQKQQENIDYSKNLIEKGIQKGIFRKQVNAELLSMMVHSAMPLMISGSVFPETRFTQSEIFRQVMLNFIRGMATAEGIELIDEKFK